MEYRGIKINYVIMIIIVVLIIYFTGNHILTHYNIEKPLYKEINELEGIKGMNLEEKQDINNIIITLNQSANLYHLYHKISEIADTIVGEGNYIIVLNNEESKHLQDIYFKAHYSIFEGIATREFSTMYENLKVIFRENNLIDYKLWIDSENIYLKLVDNNDFLFRIIPRNEDVRGGENVG